MTSVVLLFFLAASNVTPEISPTEVAEAIERFGAGPVSAADIRRVSCKDKSEGWTEMVCRWKQWNGRGWKRYSGRLRVDAEGLYFVDAPTPHR